MPLFDEFAWDIDHAHHEHLDHLCHEVWRAHRAGDLTDDEAQSLAELARDRQRPKPPSPPPTHPRASTWPLRRPQRSPDKRRSIERRRRLAASGPLPPQLACRFTVSETAALRIVADEVIRTGVCCLCLDAIAARAGCCRTVVKNALREAARLGLVTIQERPRQGQASLTNVIRIISKEWLAWLRRARCRPGVIFSTPTDTSVEKKGVRQDKSRAGQGT